MPDKPRFFITDVFGQEKYSGNQLATFVDCADLSTIEMQQIAKEINFSETTFITSREPRNGGYDVRIFTPQAEVEFAGHPTIGTAAIIRDEIIRQDVDKLTLNLPIGQIPVRFEHDTGIVWMTQAKPETGKTYPPAELAEVLNLDQTDIDSNWPVEEVSTGFPTLIVPLVSLAAVRAAKIKQDMYIDLVRDAWAKIILVFAAQAYEKDQSLAVRVFADYYGISEDAATGSSNGALAGYLARHKYFGSKSIDIKTGQGYEMGRPSCLLLQTDLDDEDITVHVGGKVVRVAAGYWG